MGAIFISHSHSDNAFAGALADRLQGWGHRSLFLDFHGEHGIHGGQTWEQELYRRLRMCRAMLVVCSEASMASKWCFAEIAHARALGKPVIPLKVETCAIEGILRDRQVLDLREATEEAWRRLEHALRREGLDPSDTFDWDPGRPPYPGLLAFQEADAAVYHGREEDIRGGLEAINRLSRLGGASVLLLLGDSGSGKSSLLRAGLLPRLRRDPERWLVLDVFRPTSEPASEAGNVIAAALRARGVTVDGASIREGLRRACDNTNDAEGSARLGEYARDLRLAAGTAEARVLLFVDQAEELFTRAKTPERLAFAALLRAACASGLYLVIGSLRSDFLGTWQRDAGLSELPVETLALAPLAQTVLRSVVTEPAAVSGLELEPTLVDALVEDAGDVNALPLLAFGLRELWERRPSSGRLELDVYREELGGLEGAVARSAERTLKSACRTATDEDRVRRAFLAMARLDESGAFVGRPLPWSEVDSTTRALLEPFVSARLLVSRGDDEGSHVEVAHEALFVAWDRLAAWLEGERETLRIVGRLQREAAAWDETGRHTDLLLPPGRRLEEALSIRHSGLDLSSRESEFVRRSDASARRKRVVRIATASLVAILAAAAIAFALVAGVERREGERKRQETALLSDAKLLRDLVDRMRDFDLLDPRTEERIDRWLTDVRGLEESVPRHRSTLASLDTETTHGAWQARILEELLNGIERMTDAERGFLADVLALQRRQRELVAQSIEAHGDAWASAAEYAAGEARYTGLELRPQIGLVPLGPDPVTGLLEFAHVGSGNVLERAPSGDLQLESDMALVFVLVPGATLWIGAQSDNEEETNYDALASDMEGPPTRVRVAPFLLSKFECTQAQWGMLRGEAGAGNSGSASPTARDGLLPVVEITWDEADKVCARHDLRLPIEAEWEYACRATAGDYVAWSTGNDKTDVRRVANLADAPIPVGSLPPNAFGLHDMHGNVWEWCGAVLLRYDEKTSGPPDEDGERVCRGGGHDYAPRFGRCSARSSNLRVHRSPSLGFRPARSIFRPRR